MTLRKRVATALGVSEATVGRVVADWNKRNDGEFTPHLKAERPSIKPAAVIHNLVFAANSSGTPLSTTTLRKQLEENGFVLQIAAMAGVTYFGIFTCKCCATYKDGLKSYKEYITFYTVLGGWGRSLQMAKEYMAANYDVLFAESDDEFDEFEEEKNES
jgi:hypothetical protein